MSDTKYPLMQNAADDLKALSGRPLSEITLDAVAKGSLTPDDMRIQAETLRLQAQVAEQAGYTQLAANLRRAAELTAIPGIGPWTAQGALLVALQREDVVLPGDLALRKAVQAAYQLDHLPTQQEVLAIAEKWRPHRSLATSYLFSAAFEPAGTPPVAPSET